MSDQVNTHHGALILVIEDDASIRRLLRTSLTGNGYRLAEAITAQEGLQLASARHPDLIILDLGLPDLDGLEVTRQLRTWTKTPIVILSARGQENDKIAVLDAGADDYLTKPFSASELLARLRVALRHALRVSQGIDETLFILGDLRVDTAKRQVFIKMEEIHLTPLEYKLLLTLIHYAGRAVTNHQLLREVWGPEYVNEAHYVRIYMGQLRHKLEVDPARPHYILTEPRIGYRLKID